jgi:large subunit ribosomal protein L24
MSQKMHIKVGDTVKVLAGESRGKEGEVTTIDRAKNRAKVNGLNMVTKHVKPNAANPQGGREEVEAGIHISNLMVVAGGQASRVGRRKNDDGKNVRYSKKTDKEI